MDAQHASQAVLADARGVHPQLQIGINVSIQGHGFRFRFLLDCSVLWGAAETVAEKLLSNRSAKPQRLICQHIVAV